MTLLFQVFIFALGFLELLAELLRHIFQVCQAVVLTCLAPGNLPCAGETLNQDFRARLQQVILQFLGLE